MDGASTSPLVFVPERSSTEDSAAITPCTVQAGGASGRGGGEETTEAGKVDGLKLDDALHGAALDGNKLPLTPVEYSLLKPLISQPGRIFSRDQLMNEMYSDYRIVSDRAVDTHIKNLRKKLATAGAGKDLVESVYGLGYRYAG